MHIEEFTAATDDFARWMVNRLTTGRDQFEHTWVSLGGRQTVYKKDYPWTCDSLFEAYRQYRWKSEIQGKPVETFEETTDALDTVKESLLQAIDAPAGKHCLELIEEILRWGNVHNSATDLRNLNTRVIPKYLANAKTYFDEIDDTSRKFKFGRNKLVTDSGTTKIFSLICNKFAMLDGRVGAALGLLVRQWALEEVGLNKVPSCLRFGWGRAVGEKSSITSRRDPNPPAPFQRLFKEFKNDRTEQNIFVNWLLDRVLLLDSIKPKSESSEFMQLHEDVRLRALEAALFMIGYTVNDAYLPNPTFNVK